MFCRSCIINERSKPDLLLIVAGYNRQRLDEPAHDMKVQAIQIIIKYHSARNAETSEPVIKTPIHESNPFYILQDKC